MEYFIFAIQFISERSPIKFSRVLIFSDEIDVAKQLFSNLKVSVPVQFAVSPVNYPKEDLIPMSKTGALIMSNSPFSWWAAQLGKST